MDRERDEHGRFKKKPPGNQETYDLPDIDDLDFWDSTEAMLKTDLKSTNDTVRQKAMSTYLKWKDMKNRFDEKTKPKYDDKALSTTMAMLTILGAVVRKKVELDETVRRVQEHCPSCKKMGNPIPSFNLPVDESKC